MKDDVKKWARRAGAFGAVLALICNHLPTDYQVVCNAIARVCTLGM